MPTSTSVPVVQVCCTLLAVSLALVSFPQLAHSAALGQSAVPSGALPIVEQGTDGSCTQAEEGHLRYHRQVRSVQVCTGSEWLLIGSTAQRFPTSCGEVLNNGESTGDGLYTLGDGSGSSYAAYCDMTTEGGGWTLFATKVTPAAGVFSASQDLDSAKAVDQDSAGCIPQKANFSQVLFRFRSDATKSILVYTPSEGVTNQAQSDFNSFLQCGTPTQAHSQGTVGGFYKKTSYESQGARVPSAGFHTIHHYFVISPPMGAVTETSTLSDKWLNLWTSADVSNNYHATDSSSALGTKCVAGVCYISEPIWLMYR